MHRDEDSAFLARFASKDKNCTFRTVQQLRCRTELDKNGVPQRNCHRLLKKFKECPGLPTEIIEHVEKDVNPGKGVEEGIFSNEDVFADVGSEMESMFSRVLGTSDGKSVTSGDDKRDYKPFRQKLGDYFAWERDCQTRTAKKQCPEWKQFEGDFQEV